MTLRDVAGHRIALVERGAGGPVLFLHGNPVDHRDLLAALDPVFARRSGYRRFHPDLPGYGASPPEPTIVGSDGMLDVVVELFDALTDGRPALVVGASWGAYLARGLAARRREHVAGIALLAPAVIADRTRRDLDPFVNVVPPAGPLEGGPAEWRDAFLEGAVVAGPEQWAHYRDRIAPALDAADAEAIERIEAAYPFREDVDRIGPPIDVPALIVTGRQDEVVGYRDAVGLLARFPRATWVALDVAGHGLMVDRPAVVAALVDDWLDRVELAGRPPRMRLALTRSPRAAARDRTDGAPGPPRSPRSPAGAGRSTPGSRRSRRTPRASGTRGRARRSPRPRPSAVAQPSTTRPRPIMNAARA